MGHQAVPEFVAGAMIIVGAWFVLFGKPLAVYFAYYQHKLFKLVNVDVAFNRRIVAAMRIAFAAVGAFLIAMGLFALVAILRQ